MLSQDEQRVEIIKQHLKDFAKHTRDLRDVREDDIAISAMFLAQALMIADIDRHIEHMAGERDLASGSEHFPY